jgi:glyoxylase-like metal-dependent hydrolase (beta-lactamase superfamily II)
MPAEYIHTIDLHFQGLPNAIASYLVVLSHSAVLIEPGPASTLPQLLTYLHQLGLSPEQVSDIFVTHIHLDHAGVVGWFARQGSTIHVHPNGAPHLINPEKLLNSAQRIYGDQMQPLWGEFLAVPQSQIHIPLPEETIKINGAEFHVLDTPGHAEHHYCILYEDILFSGDIGGIRIPRAAHLELPTPPPEFHPAKWRKSIQFLQSLPLKAIAPTHFGIYSDAQAHLSRLLSLLDDLEAWMEKFIPPNPTLEEINRLLDDWLLQQGRGKMQDADLPYLHFLNPSWMSAAGILRYWTKVRPNQKD